VDVEERLRLSQVPDSGDTIVAGGREDVLDLRVPINCRDLTALMLVLVGSWTEGVLVLLGLAEGSRFVGVNHEHLWPTNSEQTRLAWVELQHIHRRLRKDLLFLNHTIRPKRQCTRRMTNRGQTT
jgi:hypothetical protein